MRKRLVTGLLSPTGTVQVCLTLFGCKSHHPCKFMSSDSYQKVGVILDLQSLQMIS